jgi:RHS repeat-associated protein
MKSGSWRDFSLAAYDPAGLMVGKTLGNGVEYTAVFDAVNRQVTCTWEVGNQTLAGYNYAYDDASNRKYEEKIHDPSNSQLYQYDTLYQVKKFEAGLLDGTKTSILAPDRTQGWNYDPMGNWRRFIDSDAIGVNVAQRRNHNEVNELIQITDYKVDPPVPTALAYDANGNLVDDGEFLYTWDAFNRLVEVRLKADSSIIVGQYFYDAMHRRTKRLANLDGNASLETQATYVYDGFNCIYEIPNPKSAIPPTAYVWGNDINGGLQSAGGVGGLVAVSQNGSIDYPLFDARGNVTAYANSSGAIVATFDYLPFGALASSTGNADAFSYRFSTKPFDPETGLVYYNFRYYSPELGRWMGRDPIEEEGGYNLYGIVGNNSVNKIDYLGLEDDCKCCDNTDWLDCMSSCLSKFDYLGKTTDALLVGNSIGNAAVAKPFATGTTGKSTSWLSKFGSSFKVNLPARILKTKNALRAAGRVATVLTIAEGFYKLGNIISCSAICGIDPCLIE